MKKQQLTLISGAALLVLFAVGAFLYKQQRAETTAAMAKESESPLMRSYAPSLGPADAKVVIVEFFDPGCEACAAFAAPVKSLLSSHPGKVRLVLRYAPFHHGADTMVKILEAGRLQGKYWETLQVMFDTQAEWASHHHPQPDRIWQYLPTAGLDLERLRSDMNRPEILEILRQDMEDANALGVRKTPEFFVNSKPLPSFGFAQLEGLVEAEVAAQYGR